jgi:Zn-dependent protease with chaperone function
LAAGFFQLFKFFIQPFENYVSHICEYQADAFSVSIGHGNELIKAMPKMHALGNALAEPIYGIFLYTHPVYSARIRALVEKVSSSPR